MDDFGGVWHLTSHRLRGVATVSLVRTGELLAEVADGYRPVLFDLGGRRMMAAGGTSGVRLFPSPV